MQENFCPCGSGEVGEGSADSHLPYFQVLYIVAVCGNFAVGKEKGRNGAVPVGRMADCLVCAAGSPVRTADPSFGKRGLF